MFETIAAVGVPLVMKIASLIEEARTASAERHAQILAELQAADGALDKAQADAHASVEAETKETQDAIAAHKDPTP